MPIIENEITYLTATEASEALGLSRQRFYQSLKPLLTEYRLLNRKAFHYRKDEVLAYKSIAAPVKLPIVIQGMQKNFEMYMREQGYEVTVDTIDIPDVIAMSEHVANIFHLPVGSPVVSRKRRHKISGAPYRIVTNYYPVELVNSEMLAAMRTDDETDILKLIEQAYGLLIHQTVDRVKARRPDSQERRLLSIRVIDPVMELSRVNYAEDGMLILFNEVICVAEYFEFEYSYQVSWQTHQ